MRVRVFESVAAVVLAAALAGPLEAAEFHSWVATGYRHREPLTAWSSTARLLASRHSGTIREGASPAELRTFLAGLAGTEAVVYIAAHHDTDGRIDFPDRTSASWSAVLPASGLERVVFLLDLCHGEAALRDPAWSLAKPRLVVTTSRADEPAWEIPLLSPRVSDAARIHPQVVDELRKRLGSHGQERISYWGLGWLASQPVNGRLLPGNRADWERAVSAAQEAADRVQSRRGVAFRSHFAVHAPGDSPP